MSRPTPEELETAINEAIRLREKGEDQYYLGKSLLNLNYRLDFLEKVMIAAKEFLHSGLSGKEQTDLIRAIEKAEKAAQLKTEDDVSFFDNNIPTVTNNPPHRRKRS